MNPNLSPTYKISMDEIDLGYLTKKFLQRNGAVKPIWDVSTRDKHYFEFEVFAEKNDESLSGCEEVLDNSTPETCICHICNVSIPIIYIREHNGSAKHKVNLELADKVMERMRKHIMTQYVDIPKTRTLANTYFCTFCAVVVQVSEKSNHENTKKHVLSVKHDDLLDNLLRVYNCNDNIKTDMGNLMHSKDIVKEIAVVNVDRPLNDKVVPGNAALNTAAKISNAENDALTSLSAKIRTSENLGKVDIKDHHHMQKTDNNNESFCKVCRIRIPSIAVNIEAHVNDMSHKSNYNKIVSKLKKIGNKYYCESCKVFIKDNCEVDHMAAHTSHEGYKRCLLTGNVNTGTISASVNKHEHMQVMNGVIYCKVCKVPIVNANIGEHVNGAQHKINYNSLITTNKLCKIEDDYYCVVCKATLPEDTTFSHIKSDKHKNNLKTQQPNNTAANETKVAANSTKQSKETKINLINYILTLNRMNTEDTHVLSLIDEDFLEIKTEFGMRIKVAMNNFHGYHEDGGITQCKVCRQILKGSLESHKLTNEHMQRMAAPITNMNCIRQIDTLSSHCIICNEIVVSGATHAKLKEHRSRMKEALIQSDGRPEIISIHYSPTAAKTHCIVCDIYIDSHNYKSHAKGRNHLSNYDTSFPNTPVPVDLEAEDIQNRHYHIAKTRNPEKMYCKTCKVHVPSDDIDEHVKEFCHRSSYHSMLDSNIITVTNGYFCEVCKVYISKFDVADHAYSDKHASNTITESAAKDHYHVERVDDTNLLCRVCNNFISNKQLQIKKHINSPDHNTKYNELIFANKLRKLDERYMCECYYCDVCDTLLVEEEEFDHIKDKNHLAALAKSTSVNDIPKSDTETLKIHHHMQTTDNPKELLCKVCRVIVPVSAIHVEEHVKGNNHIKNYNIITGTLKKVDNRYYCECCKVFIKTNCEVDHIATHLKPEEHMKFLQGAKCTEIPSTFKNTEQRPAEVNIHHHMILSNGVLKCRVCNVPVPNNPNCISVHVNGGNHKTNYDKLIKTNKLVKQNGGYKCEVCKTGITMNAELLHVATNKHKCNLSTKPSTSNSTPDATSTNTTMCIICNVKVPNNERNIAEHNNGSFHKGNMKKFCDTLGQCKVN